MPIGVVAAGVAAAGAIGGAVISSNAAGKAASTQAAAADNATQLNRDIYNQNRTDLAPWRQTGSSALAMLANGLGLNGSSGDDAATGAFKTSPGYDFAFSQGQRAVNGSAGAKGMYGSGARAKALTTFGEGEANQEYGGWINNLKTLAGFGQTANAQGQQAGQQFAASTGTAMQDAAAARASGYVGSSNAISGGLNNLAKLAGSYGGGSSGGNNGFLGTVGGFNTSGGWVPDVTITGAQ